MKINFSNTAAEILALLAYLSDNERNLVTETFYNDTYESQSNIKEIEHLIFPNLGKLGGADVMDFNLSQINYCLNGARKFRFQHEIFDLRLCEKFPKFNIPFHFVYPKVSETETLTADEMLKVVKFLEKRLCYGVVVNCPEFPESEWVTKIETNFKESIEVLKQAKLGYIGIVSDMAILASKKFDAHSMLIKAPQLVEGPWAKFFFAPHKEPNFVYSDLISIA